MRSFLARSSPVSEVQQQIIEFWSALEDLDTGQTSREVLYRIRDNVTDALTLDVPDIATALSETSKAMCLIGGIIEHE
ncbi:hypothetical protein [Humisphaera borealis]|uniref:Uncharacterized protein n=1 Tax=Humisphaera borealis TaxID=2807512 RepID=A0A7M2WVG3_9BACT|nr:hypothetical protein [Humisphaera borealis]QOV89475.1 hypothetical protein IPV69_25305 [Humisphaera borealis]